MLFCHFIYQHPSGMRIGRFFLQAKLPPHFIFFLKRYVPLAVCPAGFF